MAFADCLLCPDEVESSHQRGLTFVQSYTALPYKGDPFFVFSFGHITEKK